MICNYKQNDHSCLEHLKLVPRFNTGEANKAKMEYICTVCDRDVPPEEVYTKDTDVAMRRKT